MLRALLLAAASLCLASGLTPAVAGEKLSTAELRQLFPGTFTAVVKGYTVKIAARAGGTLTGHAMGLTDTGHWSVQGGKLCISMQTWTEGKANCSPVVAEQGWYRGRGVRFQKL